MGKVGAIYTSSTEDGDKRVFHDQTECGYRKEIVKNGNDVAGEGSGRTQCKRCAELEAEG